MRRKLIIVTLLAMSMTFSSIGCGKNNEIITENEVMETQVNMIDADNENMDYKEKPVTTVMEKVTEVTTETEAVTEVTEEGKGNSGGGNSGGGHQGGGEVVQLEHFDIMDIDDDMDFYDIENNCEIEDLYGYEFLVILQRLEDNSNVFVPMDLRDKNAKYLFDYEKFELCDDETVVVNNGTFGTRGEVGNPSEPKTAPIYFEGKPVRLNNMEFAKEHPANLIYVEFTQKEDTKLNTGNDISNSFIKGVYINRFDSDCGAIIGYQIHVGCTKEYVEKESDLKGLTPTLVDGMYVYKSSRTTVALKYNSENEVSDILLLMDKINYETEWKGIGDVVDGSSE